MSRFVDPVPSPPDPGRPRPSERQRGRRPLVWLVLLAMLPLSSCTFENGKQLEVDFLGARYRFYVYERPTALLAYDLRKHCKEDRGPERRNWARCSLEYLHDHVDVPTIGRHEWGIFTNFDQWDDYGEAVDQVAAGGYGFDGRGDRYARLCLVGDHMAFSSYNWTTRPMDNAHCKRGEGPR